MRSLRARTPALVTAALVASSAALLAVSACSSDVELATADPPLEDAGAPESPAPSDAATDVEDGGSDADAPARTCTDDGFCHLPLPEPLPLRGVWGDGVGTVWAVSADGAVVRWDGASWTKHVTVKGSLQAIWGSGPTDIWIGGEGGLFHGQGPSPDQIAFAPVELERDLPITSIHGSGPDDVWAVGGRSDFDHEESHVLHYAGPTADPADAWRLDPISERVTEFARVWGATPDEVWLGGTTFLSEPQGAVLVHGRKADGGMAFEDVPLTNTRGQFRLVTGGAVLSELFVVGRYWSGIGAAWSGPIGDAGDAGRVWDDTTFDTYFGLNAIWGVADDDVWIVGELGRVRHWDGATWTLPNVTITKFPLANDLHAVWGDAKGVLWIVGDGVALRRDPALVKGGS
ncbi:MAG: hypothetical protein KF782_20570 [Labilithrix sp.]|nr:hypothetical protein [Labilithrix sp.]